MRYIRLLIAVILLALSVSLTNVGFVLPVKEAPVYFATNENAEETEEIEETEDSKDVEDADDDTEDETAIEDDDGYTKPQTG